MTMPASIPVPNMVDATRRVGLPLTRRAMAAFAGWRRSAGLVRRNYEQSCGLHPDEVRAMERLASNLTRCGAPYGWYTWPDNKYRPVAQRNVLRALCSGLTLDEAALRDFVAACRSHHPPGSKEPPLGFDGWLEHDIRTHWKAEWDRARAAQPPPQPEPQEEPLCVRVSRELDRLRVDLTKPIDRSVKSDVARTLGATFPAVDAVIAAIRNERGVEWSREGQASNMRPRDIAAPRKETSMQAAAAAPAASGANGQRKKWFTSGPAYERVAAEIQRRGIPVMEPVSADVKEAIAKSVPCGISTIVGALADIRNGRPLPGGQVIAAPKQTAAPTQKERVHAYLKEHEISLEASFSQETARAAASALGIPIGSVHSAVSYLRRDLGISTERQPEPEPTARLGPEREPPLDVPAALVEPDAERILSQRVAALEEELARVRADLHSACEDIRERDETIGELEGGRKHLLGLLEKQAAASASAVSLPKLTIENRSTALVVASGSVDIAETDMPTWGAILHLAARIVTLALEGAE